MVLIRYDSIGKDKMPRDLSWIESRKDLVDSIEIKKIDSYYEAIFYMTCGNENIERMFILPFTQYDFISYIEYRFNNIQIDK